MEIGMLWFDNDPKKPLAEKVERAADYYRQKYGLVPDLCLVHPSMLVEPRPEFVEGRSGKVAVRANRAILPGHLWIGVDEAAQ
jgi:hypothetical protein